MSDDVAVGSGAEGSSSVGTNPAGDTTASQQGPTVYDIPDDNALIRVNGAKEPVKFGDYSRGFQAQATRAAQEAANLRRELQAERSRREQFERQQAARQAQGQQGPDPFEQLRSLQYLDGETAAKVVQSIAGQIQQRDQIILGLAQELQKVQKMVGTLNENHVSSNFSGKIDRFLSDGGYGPELKNFATELYLAYEPGPELDAEFPQILASRVDELTKFVEAKRAANLAASRKQPFVPGRGGQAGPNKPLQIRPDASAKEIADLMWPGDDQPVGT